VKGRVCRVYYRMGDLNFKKTRDNGVSVERPFRLHCLKALFK